jgi:hypothetical protein
LGFVRPNVRTGLWRTSAGIYRPFIFRRRFQDSQEWDDYRRGEQREPIFSKVSLNLEKKSAVYCYEYHKELLHNPVLTADDISGSIAEK